MSCYCANYYGSINCHNKVARFGDRCKLCLALKSGASLSNGMLPEDEAWFKQASRKDEPRVRNRGDNHMGRSVRIESRIKN